MLLRGLREPVIQVGRAGRSTDHPLTETDYNLTMFAP